MSSISTNRRLLIGMLVLCLATAGTQGAALASTPTVLPPDRVDRIGVTDVSAPDAPRVQLPPDRADRIGAAAQDAPRVQLPPDRADGLGTARLPTMPTPVVMVRTVYAHRFDWLAALVGAAMMMALVLATGAALVARAHRMVASPKL